MRRCTAETKPFYLWRGGIAICASCCTHDEPADVRATRRRRAGRGWCPRSSERAEQQTHAEAVADQLRERRRGSRSRGGSTAKAEIVWASAPPSCSAFMFPKLKKTTPPARRDGPRGRGARAATSRPERKERALGHQPPAHARQPVRTRGGRPMLPASPRRAGMTSSCSAGAPADAYCCSTTSPSPSRRQQATP